MSKGSAPAPIEESSYSKAMSGIAKQQYQNYLDNYKPYEDALLAKASANPLADLGKAKDFFDKSNAMTDGIQQRSIDRYGGYLSDAQKQAKSRLSALGTAAATGKGITDFGTNAVNQNIALQGQLAGLGQASIKNALDGYGAANSNYMSQEQQYQQAVAAQNQANMGSTNATIGAAAMAAMMMMSDQTLKENIAVIPDALDKVSALHGVTWDWNEAAQAAAGLEGPSSGVIAQDVQAVLPQAVSKVGEHLMVNYAAVVGLLVNAVNTLKAEVDTLKGGRHAPNL